MFQPLPVQPDLRQVLRKRGWCSDQVPPNRCPKSTRLRASLARHLEQGNSGLRTRSSNPTKAAHGVPSVIGRTLLWWAWASRQFKVSGDAMDCHKERKGVFKLKSTISQNISGKVPCLAQPANAVILRRTDGSTLTSQTTSSTSLHRGSAI